MFFEISDILCRFHRFYFSFDTNCHLIIIGWDEIRFYLMFIGHYFDGGSWNDQNINGVKRFVQRFSNWMQ